MKFTDFLLVTSVNILSYGLPIGLSIYFSIRLAIRELKKEIK